MRRIPLPVVVPVKGVSFHQDVVCSVTVGQPLEVVAEPQNEFDPNACAVLASGEVLGHLPREIAGRLRADGGLCWSAEVVEVLRGSKATGLRIRLLAPAEPLDRPSASGPRPTDDEPSVEPRAESRVAPCDADEETESVFARSGRRLGRLIERTDGSVRVLTEDERIVAYPESLVVLSR